MLFTINVVNFRDYADNKHQTVDDYPYGGGAGMVLKPQPIFDAVADLAEKSDVNTKSDSFMSTREAI